MSLSQAPTHMMPDVIFQDAQLIVLNKPSGLLSVPGRGPEKADCLSARVQAVYPDALVVHRLDMDTSGLLVMARGIEAQRLLSASFAQRLVNKQYAAVVWGTPTITHPENEWQSIDLPLIVDWPNRPKSKVCFETGKPSLTHWRIASSPTNTSISVPHTRLELQPVTGRSHQLRVHLLSTGHPILGDPLYGADFEGNDQVERAAPRLLLHASHLSLLHPETGSRMEWTSPPPF